MSMIDPRELRKIVRFCQKNGILKFKSGDFEIEIAKYHAPVRDSSAEATADMNFPAWDTLTPEQKLLWSSTPDGING